MCITEAQNPGPPADPGLTIGAMNACGLREQKQFARRSSLSWTVHLGSQQNPPYSYRNCEISAGS